MEQAFSRHEHPGRCDVCGKEGLVVTNRSSFGPFDFHYCEECFRTGAEPYWFTVSTVALFGLWPDDVNEAFQAKIRKRTAKNWKSEFVLPLAFVTVLYAASAAETSRCIGS